MCLTILEDEQHILKDYKQLDRALTLACRDVVIYSGSTLTMEQFKEAELLRFEFYFNQAMFELDNEEQSQLIG